MSSQFFKYFGIITLYLYFIILGIELVIIEGNTISYNVVLYNYITYINIFYIVIVLYFLFKIIELLFNTRCLNENEDKELLDAGNVTFFIYLIMGSELIINCIYYFFSSDFIEHYKTAFMEIPLFQLYVYPKLTISCFVTFSYCLIVIFWVVFLLDVCCCDSFFVNTMTTKYKKTCKNNKVKPKDNYLRQRRNRVSLCDDL